MIMLQTKQMRFWASEASKVMQLLSNGTGIWPGNLAPLSIRRRIIYTELLMSKSGYTYYETYQCLPGCKGLVEAS